MHASEQVAPPRLDEIGAEVTARRHKA